MTTQSLSIAQRIFSFLFKTPQHISPPEVSVIAAPRLKRKRVSYKNNKNKIKRIRTKLGMSQTQFGFELGCSQTSVGLYERNEVKIPVKTFQRLVAFAAKNGMGISYDDIYGPALKPAPTLDKAAEARKDSND